MNLEVVKVITEAGSVGVSAGLMFLFYRLAVLFNKTMNNHFAHTEMAYRDLVKVLDKHTEVLNEVSVTISGCKNNKYNR